MNARSLPLRTNLREAPRLGRVVAGAFGCALAALETWHARWRMRRQLARWASGAGYGFVEGTSVSSCDAYEEANKPFWRP